MSTSTHSVYALWNAKYRVAHMCLFHLDVSIFFLSPCNLYVWNMCSSELIYLVISFTGRRHNAFAKCGVFGELKGSSTGICFEPMQLICLEHLFFRADLFVHFFFFTGHRHNAFAKCGLFGEQKGSSAGICLHLKPDCIFCACR